MDKYEQEIFNFLAQRENFEAMLRLNNTYPIVKTNLLEQFWNLVAEKLEKKLADIEGMWQLYNPPNKEHHQAKLIIYKQSWQLNSNERVIGIAWEHLYTQPYFGVWYNIDSKKLNPDKLISQLEQVRNKNAMKIDTGWWPAWKYGEYILSNDANVTSILPDIRDSTAEMYSVALINLIPDVEKLIDNEMAESK